MATITMVALPNSITHDLRLQQVCRASFEAILAASFDWLAVQVLQPWSALHGILLRDLQSLHEKLCFKPCTQGKIS